MNFPVVIELTTTLIERKNSKFEYDLFRYKVCFSSEDFPENTEFKILGSVDNYNLIDPLSLEK